jgi:hypothetical protein
MCPVSEPRCSHPSPVAFLGDTLQASTMNVRSGQDVGFLSQLRPPHLRIVSFALANPWLFLSNFSL